MHSTPSPDSIANNAELIAAFKSGSIAAFERVYVTHFEKLCHYTSTFVSDDEAADIVQDVFELLWNHRQTFTVQTVPELTHYLFRSVRNRALNVLRHQKVRAAYVAEIEALELEKHDEVNPNLSLDVGEQALDRLRDVIDSLPPRARELLVLRWYNGFGLEQIASLMEVSYGSVRVLHSRALDMLRTRLQLSSE